MVSEFELSIARQYGIKGEPLPSGVTNPELIAAYNQSKSPSYGDGFIEIPPTKEQIDVLGAQDRWQGEVAVVNPDTQELEVYPDYQSATQQISPPTQVIQPNIQPQQQPMQPIKLAPQQQKTVKQASATQVEFERIVALPANSPELKRMSEKITIKPTMKAPDWKPVTVLASAIPVALAEPTPFGEVAVAAVAAGALLYVGGKWAADNRQAIVNGIVDARGNLRDFAQSAIITADGKVTEFSAEAKKQIAALDDWAQVNVFPKIEQAKTNISEFANTAPPPKLEGVKLQVEDIKSYITEFPLQQAKANIEKVLNTTPPPSLDGIDMTLSDVKSFIIGVPLMVKGKMDDIFTAIDSAVETANTALADIEIEKLDKMWEQTTIDFDVIEEAYKTVEQKAISDALSMIGSSMNRLDDAQNVLAAGWQNYLHDLEVKRQIIEDATKSFVASLAPAPVAGTPLTPAQASSVASILIKNQDTNSSPAKSVVNSTTTIQPTITNTDTVVGDIVANTITPSPVVEKVDSIIQSATTLFNDMQKANYEAPDIKLEVKTFIDNQVMDITDTNMRVQIVPLTNQITELVTKVVPNIDTETITKPATKTETKTLPQTETQISTKTLTPTIPTEITTPVETTIPNETITTTELSIPIKPIILPLISGGELKLTKKQVKSLVSWKQGWDYKMIWYPYGKKNRYDSRRPIDGVEYAEGIGSAQRSAIARGLPADIFNWDMGVVSINFTGMDDGKPDMKFTQRIKNPKRAHTIREIKPTISRF